MDSTDIHHLPFYDYLLSHNMEAFKQGIQTEDVFWGVGGTEGLLSSNLYLSSILRDMLDTYENSPTTSSNSSVASHSPQTPSTAALPEVPLPMVNNCDNSHMLQRSSCVTAHTVYPELEHDSLHGFQNTSPHFSSSELAHAFDEKPRSKRTACTPSPGRHIGSIPLPPTPSSVSSPCISTSLLTRSNNFDHSQILCSVGHAYPDMLQSSTTSDWGQINTEINTFVPNLSPGFMVLPSADMFEATSTTLDPRVFDFSQSLTPLASMSACASELGAVVESTASTAFGFSETASTSLYASALDLDLGVEGHTFQRESPVTQPYPELTVKSDEETDSDPDWSPSPQGRTGRRTSFRYTPMAPKAAAARCPKHSSRKLLPSPSKPSPDNLKTFWCYACNRGFSRSADKDRHMETYHKLQGIPCHICKGTFSRADALRRHLLKGCTGKARKRRSRAWELAAQRAAQEKEASELVEFDMEAVAESLLD